MPEHGIVRGDPVARPHPRAWVQVAATALSQTANTMKLFRGAFTDACISEHGIDIGKEVIYAYAGQKQIEAVTSSPRALEGNRPTLVIVNEPHQWIKSNAGLAMYDAIERNAAKAKGGASRVLAITNAYEPSEESVGRKIREAYDLLASSGWEHDSMYDSLEAPKDARLRAPFPDEQKDAELKGINPLPEPVKQRISSRYIGRVLEAVRGDAWWLDIPSLTSSIQNPKNKASRSRRFWYNQITASEDAWVHPAAVDAAIHPGVSELRRGTSDPALVLEAGWQLVGKDEPIVVFFDGSKSDDSTVIIGCRLSDGYCFLIGVWGNPGSERGANWLAPRGAVDKRVAEMFKRFKVVAFWGDPSHAKQDEGQETEASYWMPFLDKWMREYKSVLDQRHWPVKSGMREHAINWDMTSADRTKIFIAAAEQTVSDFENLNDVEEFSPTFFIDGHPVLVQHLKNAIKHYDPRGWGESLAKIQKDSPRKIDAAVALVGARMLRRVVLNSLIKEEPDQPGEIWNTLVSDSDYEAAIAETRTWNMTRPAPAQRPLGRGIVSTG